MVHIDVASTTLAPPCIALLCALIALLGGCRKVAPGNARGAASSATDAAFSQDEPPAHPSPQQVEQPATLAVTLACGRASAALPGDAVVVPEQTRPCVDSGYPEDVEAAGVAGGQSEHVVRVGGCDLKLAAKERLPMPNASEPARGSAASNAEQQVELTTPEGSVFYVKVAAVASDCPEQRARVVEALKPSLRVVPLREPGAHARATISSAGHGFELDVPPGFYVVSAGGMADQYETAYQLRGPKGAWATLYTSWRGKPSAAPGPFVPNLLGARTRWRSSVVDLGTDVEGCRGSVAVGPDKRLRVELTLCGPEAGYLELEQLLRAIRLTPPRSKTESL